MSIFNFYLGGVGGGGGVSRACAFLPARSTREADLPFLPGECGLIQGRVEI